MNEKLIEIENSKINGQIKQMVTQIDEYGNEFWIDYLAYVENFGVMQSHENRYSLFVSITKAYWYRKNR